MISAIDWSKIFKISSYNFILKFNLLNFFVPCYWPRHQIMNWFAPNLVSTTQVGLANACSGSETLSWCDCFRVEIIIFLLKQIPIAIVTLLLNFYCIVCFVFVKSLWKMDFFLVFVQTVCDFLLTGFCGTVYYSFLFRFSIVGMCYISDIFYDYGLVKFGII